MSAFFIAVSHLPGCGGLIAFQNTAKLRIYQSCPVLILIAVRNRIHKGPVAQGTVVRNCRRFHKSAFALFIRQRVRILINYEPAPEQRLRHFFVITGFGLLLSQCPVIAKTWLGIVRFGVIFVEPVDGVIYNRLILFQVRPFP